MAFQTDKEKRMARIVFWWVSPLIFSAFLRLFVLVFYYIFGSVLIWLFGERFRGIVDFTAFLSALGFAFATMIFLYRQYKMHIIGEH